MTAERGPSAEGRSGYRAVVFDMDGVLVDSEPAFFEAVNLVLAPTGIESARAAGMFAVQVRAASTALPPIAEADLVIDTYAELPLSLLDGALLEEP